MKLHMERETTYVSDQCPVTKKWSKNKLEFTKNFVVYNTVGSPAYQTPVFTGTKAQCAEFIKKNS